MMINIVKYLFLKKICTILDMLMMMMMMISGWVFVYEVSGCGFESRCSHFDRFVSVRNNIVNLINNDNYKHKITLLADDFRIRICENNIY